MKRQVFCLYLFWATLLLPNVVLAFTERMSVWGRIALLLLPAALYGLALTGSRKPGKALWLLFPVLFVGAFQLVLSYLFERGVIAVDMWLNLVTTNAGEVNELLAQLEPAVAAICLIYLPVLGIAVLSIRHQAVLPDGVRR